MNKVMQGVLLAGTATFAVIAGAQTDLISKGNVSRTAANLRSTQTSLETFFIDNNRYPDYTTNTAEMVEDGGGPAGTPSFKVLSSTVDSSKPPMTLTTPIAYLTYLPLDVFNTETSSTMAYFGDDHGYLVWSPGPDGKYDIDWTEFDTKIKPTEAFAVKYTYDPSNGALSSGDIWRGNGGVNVPY